MKLKITGLNFFLLGLLIFLPNIIQAQEKIAVRIKEVAKIIESRDNQLIGFGLVVGLRNTGDSKSSTFTTSAMRSLLGKLGIYSGGNFNSRNVASVIVTGTLHSFVKKGQQMSVTVSSLGDCSSLKGGTLLLTSLQGSDGKVYAMAQGPVVVGGISESSGQSKFYTNQSTVGSIPNGAIVEREIPVTFLDQHNITIVLEKSNFITVTRMTKAIQENGFPGAKAIDATTIKIPLTDLKSADLISTIADLENIKLIPDSSSKIVINSKTGTVVIGEMVRLLPVALTHGNISIKITQQGGGLVGVGTTAEQEPISIVESENQLVYLNPNETLSSLVNALNEIGATPKDLISIIEALKESGALIGVVQII